MFQPVRQKESGPARSNCEFYDNRQAMNHKTLPPAFDLEDLVKTGENLIACPYYAARAMAMSAQIVFCPYNYLIEPGIRASVSVQSLYSQKYYNVRSKPLKYKRKLKSRSFYNKQKEPFHMISTCHSTLLLHVDASFR